MKYDLDVLICYAVATGSELARTLQDCLTKKGYYALLFDDPQAKGKMPAVCVPVYTQGLFAATCVSAIEDALKNDRPIVPVWFNNCKDWKMPEELPDGVRAIVGTEVSTLDFLGTDFNLSLDKAISRFPIAIRESSQKIVEARQTGDWVSILSEHPETVNHPDLLERHIISQLSDIEWAYLIATQPTLLRKDAWELIKNNSYVWRVIICFRFSSTGSVPSDCNWRCLTGHDWLPILIIHPELACHNPWRKLSSLQWIKLLAFRPELATHCDFSKQLGYDIDPKEYKREYPQFPCPLSILVLRHPEFVDKCNLALLTGKKLVKLLIAMPSLVDSCDLENLDGTSWSVLLSAHPEFSSKCSWDKLDSETFLNSGEDWISLLDKQPQFAKRCPWQNFSTQAWIKLLIKHPEYATHRDRSTKLDEKDRAGMDWDPTLKDLLLAHPELMDRCELSGLDVKAWIELIKAHPDLIANCDINSMSAKDAMEILAEVPDLGAGCDWSHLADAKVWQWQKLCVKQPQFVEKCPVAITLEDADSTKSLTEGILDAYICSKGVSGLEIACRLKEALERRGYSVHVNSTGRMEQDEEKLLVAAKFFVLIRMNGVFDDIGDPQDTIRLQLEKAICCKKQIIVTAPTNDVWQYNGKLPKSIEGIATEQVKNLDMGDLFEEKVDALVRESMIETRGSLSREYDVFISYRRSTGARFARRVQQRLKELGYVVFLDYDSILNGKYDKVIRNAVDSAPVFLMLLTDHSLDRCADPEDWVAAEIRMAYEKGKCILPITPSDQDWKCPSNLPDDMLWLTKLIKKIVQVEGAAFNESLSEIEVLFPDTLKEKISDIKTKLQGSINIFGQKTDSVDWEDLLKLYPDLVDICPTESLPLWTKGSILIEHPYLLHKMRCRLEDFYPDVEVLSKDKMLADLEKGCHEKFWGDLIEHHPEYACKCNSSRLNSYGWGSLLRNKPEYERDCDWCAIESFDQVRILQRHPEFFDKCRPEEFDCDCWCNLMQFQPQFSEMCNWRDFEDQFIDDDYCGCVLMADLLIAQPKLAEKIDWGRMLSSDADHDGLYGLFWAEVLSKRPELSRYCDWELLYRQCDNSPWPDEITAAWPDLLCAQPQFEKYCDWRRLSSEDCARIRTVLPAVAARHVDECANVECKQETKTQGVKWLKRDLRELSRCEWATLIKRHPELEKLYFDLRRKVCVNRIHFDGSAQVDDFSIERTFADSFNKKVSSMFGQDLQYSLWAPSRRLRVKGISYKGKDGPGVDGFFYVAANDLDASVSHKNTLEASDAEIIPGLLSECLLDAGCKCH